MKKKKKKKKKRSRNSREGAFQKNLQNRKKESGPGGIRLDPPMGPIVSRFIVLYILDVSVNKDKTCHNKAFSLIES